MTPDPDKAYPPASEGRASPSDVADQLRRERELSEQIVSNSTNMILSFDRDLAIRVWNPQAERITGVPKERAWGQPAPGIPPLPALIGGEEVFWRVLAGESLRLDDRRLAIPSLGVEAVLDVLLTPLRDPNGNVEGGLSVVHDITRYKRVEEELRANEERLREAQRLAHVGSWDWDIRRNEVHCSEEVFRIAGLAPAATAVSPDFLTGLLHPTDRERWRAVLHEATAGCKESFGEARVVCPDGTERLIETRVEVFCTSEGPAYARGTWLDITERKRAQEQRERERQFRTLAENSTDIIVRLDRRLRPVYVNPAIESILDHDAAEELRRSDGDAELPPLLSAMRHQLQQVLTTGRPLAASATLPTPRGERYLDSRIVPEFGSDGAIESLLIVDRDITDIKRAQQALEELALVDPLTGIPNRRHLDKIVAQEWRREARHGHQVALIMIDIDHFKAFNDTYGHQHGDDCLHQVAQVLRRTLHRPADTAARYGGEEFLVFLPETGLEGAYELAERLRQAVTDLRVPHASSPVAGHLTISLGVAALKANEGGFRDLVAAADQALYCAKRLGRNRTERAC